MAKGKKSISTESLLGKGVQSSIGKTNRSDKDVVQRGNTNTSSYGPVKGRPQKARTAYFYNDTWEALNAFVAADPDRRKAHVIDEALQLYMNKRK